MTIASLTQARAVSRSRARMTGARAFFVFTFAWSWALWGALAISGLAALSGIGLILLLLGGFGPSLVGVALVLRGGDATLRAEFISRLISVRRIPLLWGVLAVVLPPLITVAALAVDAATGGAGANLAGAFGQTLARPGALIALVVQMLVGGALAEELGWRGYALDRLQAQSTPLWASLGLGVIWAVWHAPLFVISGTAQADLGLFSTGALLFATCIVAQSVLFTWIYNHTQRSILVAIVLHFMIDFSLTAFTGIGHAQTLSAMAWRTAFYCVAAILVVVTSWRVWTPRLNVQQE